MTNNSLRGSPFALTTTGQQHKCLNQLPKLTAQYDHKDLRKILKAVTTAILDDDLDEGQVDLVQQSAENEKVFLGLLDLCNQVLSFSSHLYRSDNLVHDLSQLGGANTSGLPQKLTDDLAMLLFGERRSEFSQAIVCHQGASLNSLVSSKYRVDMILANRRICKVMEPRIRITLQLDNGAQEPMELDVEGFQRLRYKVAMCLKELQMVKLAPVMSNP